ncbi:MAG: hypothetical protein KF774_14370 [Planctomyces sp.]|nr:hypothetical protein [Planctomyces sp.]
MHVDDVTLQVFPWDNIPTTYYSSSIKVGGAPSRLGLLTLTTSDGLEGHAFLGSALHSVDLDAESLIRVLKPVVLGQNPFERERLNAALWARRLRTTVRAIGAMDVALWDLASKAAGLPLYQYLGAYRDKVPAYCSSQMHDSPEAYVEQALAFQARGWKAYKLHSSHPWREAAAMCEAVRQAAGGEFALMLDSVWSYNSDDALELGRAIEALDFEWYEDPLPYTQIDSYPPLCAALKVPVMATEAPPNGLTHYAAWITRRATDFLRGDVAMKGGITTLLKAAHLAEAFGMRYEVHMGANSLNDVANLHVILAIRNCGYYEVLQPSAAHQFGLLCDVEIDAEGFARPPGGPGLGGEIDFDRIRRTAVSLLR